MTPAVVCMLLDIVIFCARDTCTICVIIVIINFFKSEVGQFNEWMCVYNTYIYIYCAHCLRDILQEVSVRSYAPLLLLCLLIFFFFFDIIQSIQIRNSFRYQCIKIVYIHSCHFKDIRKRRKKKQFEEKMSCSALSPFAKNPYFLLNICVLSSIFEWMELGAHLILKIKNDF